MMLRGLCFIVLLWAGCAYGAVQPNQICGYRPKTTIVDELKLDLDVQWIRNRLEKGELIHARNIYERGGFSMPAAILTLLDPPASFSYPKGTKVFGLNKEHREVHGFLQQALTWLDRQRNETARVQYSLEDESTQDACHVGGLYTFEAAILEGCFNETGTVEFVSPGKEKGMGELFRYAYDIRRENLALRTLQSFSLHASVRMKSCFDCPYFDAFSKAVEYYGSANYADKWVQAAATGTSSNFLSSRGNANFGGYTKLGRAEGILHGIVTMNVLMQVIREVENSVELCRANCQGDLCTGDDHLNSLDKSVAFFCGSLAGAEGNEEEEMLLHLLAQRRHSEFHPPSSGARTTAERIIDTFHKIQLAIVQGDCTRAGKEKEHIVDLMKVPFEVQSVLRYAYVREQNDFETSLEQEKALSFGATYAAALLPFVHACNERDAEVVYNYMKFGSEEQRPSFSKVKSALERQYKCMNIDCDDVGGLLAEDVEKGYAVGATPCNNASLEEDKSSRGRAAGILFGLTLSMMAAGALGVLYHRKRARRYRRQFPSTQTNIAAVSDLA